MSILQEEKIDYLVDLIIQNLTHLKENLKVISQGGLDIERVIYRNLDTFSRSVEDELELSNQIIKSK